jgi:hypothetical protein
MVSLRLKAGKLKDFYGQYKTIIGQYTDMRSFYNPDMLQSYLDQMGNIELHDI